MAGFHLDPLNQGWVKAWMVIQRPPGRFIRAYPTKVEAFAAAEAAGAGHFAVYGEHRLATSDFMVDPNEQATAPD